MDNLKSIKQFLFECNKGHRNAEYSDEYCIFDDMFKTFDLSKIPIEKLEKQCRNYSVLKIETFASLVSDNRKERLLVEGVKKTIDIESVKHDMTIRYGLDDWQFLIKDGENDIKVAIVVPDLHKNIDIIISDMWALGYYEVYMEPMIEGEYTYMFMRFDPMFTKDITKEVKSMKYIRHWSPKYNYDNISRNGFVPKSENSRFNYPPRVHFLKEDIDDINIKECAIDLNKHNKDNRNDGIYVLYTIDTSSIPDNVKFFGDSCYKFGVCTYDAIPFDCVVKIEEFKIG